MKKFNFVNNSEPALSAENLNQMQDNMEEVGVVVSPTEPTTNEKVWIQNTDTEKKIYCKNDNGVFDKFLNVERITENYYVQVYDSKFDDVSQIIGDGFQENKVYIITNEPLNDNNFIQSGSTHTIIGSERFNQKYGYQLSLSYGGIKFRTKFNNVWRSWQTII